MADAIARLLVDLGVRRAYGVSGGAMASLWAALSRSEIHVRHCRHEGGAAFAATEAHFASGEPVAVFTTTGPGLTNALTGLFAARGDGAKIIVLSACTSAAQRGKGAIQETSASTLPSELYGAGSLFHFATVLESADAIPQVARRLAHGLARADGFIAHIGIPTGLQSAEYLVQGPHPIVTPRRDAPDPHAVDDCAALLAEGPCAIWLGFGARFAAQSVLALAERIGAAVMCSPRAKGIFPEDHPQFVGVTGMGGHASVFRYMREQPPLWTLVLGTRLSEPTSFWHPDMIPRRGFIHVDVNPDVFGVAFPAAETLAIRADVEAFVDALLPRVTRRDLHLPVFPRAERLIVDTLRDGLIRPEALMHAIQTIAIDEHDALILAESGNSFTWASHSLRFRTPHRYRVSTGVGSMGHAATGVVGAADARGGKAVAIVGDGAMLMLNEVNTAVKFALPAVWVVLNDARYNMCEQGMAMLKLSADATMPEVDFALLARALGADGVRVEREADLAAALRHAMDARGPFVLDVRIDASRPAPSHGRNRGLQSQMTEASGAAPASGHTPHADIAFPQTS